MAERIAMKRVRMILVLASVVVLAALAAVIFVLTRGDDASPPEPRVETAETETPAPKDEPIVVVPKDNGQPAPAANETDGPKEDAFEEPSYEAEPPESPEEKALRREEVRRYEMIERMLRNGLDMTPEQIEGVPDAVVEQLAAKMQQIMEAVRHVLPDVAELAAASEKAKREGVDASRVEELKLQFRSKHEAMLMQVYSEMDEAVELMRPYLNGEQRAKLDEMQRDAEQSRQRFFARWRSE